MGASGLAASAMGVEMTWTLRDLVGATRGAPSVDLDLSRVVTEISTDTRRAVAGTAFVALSGERFDGHAFVQGALEAGAVVALVKHDAVTPSTAPVIRVADPLRALGDLAAWHRARLAMDVVAITGTNGKTTTKELTASICSAAYSKRAPGAVLKTEGNLNNLIGLPLTLLRAVGEEVVAVLEMGMNQPGEIGRLTEIARPDFATITNVGRAHLQGVGSLAGVAAAKGELFAGLPVSSTIAVNVDDVWVVKLADRFGGSKVTFGTRGDVRAERVADRGVDGSVFDLVVGGQKGRVHLSLVGQHNIQNALAAAALAFAMKLPLDAIVAGLESPAAVAMRMQVVHLPNRVTVINDAYNANPSSVAASLQALQRIPGRSVAVLGEMWELGDESRRAHQETGERAAALGIDQLVTIGALGKEIAEGALGAGMNPDAIIACDSAEQAASAVIETWTPDSVVLVKGSRGMKMEQVVRLLDLAGAES